MREYLNHILTGKSVVIQFKDGLFPIDSSHPLYYHVAKALASRAFDALEEIVDVAARIVKHTKGNFWLQDGIVMLQGAGGIEVVEKALSDKLLAFVDADLDTSALTNLHANASLNPDPEARKQLFGFLDKYHYPITADGCFVAYKRVREDFWDHHSHSIHYEVGTHVEMPREACDPDPHNACSSGLHVANYEYADRVFANGPLIEIKVNPKDVVAVPYGYEHEKMRICAGDVLRVASGPRKEHLYPRFAVGEEVVAENEDGSEVPGIVDSIVPAKGDAVQASYVVATGFGDATYLESRLRSNEPYEDDYEVLEDETEELNGSLADADDDDDACLERRVAELEKNAATKKDVDAARDAVVAKLDSITKKMNNVGGE